MPHSPDFPKRLPEKIKMIRERLGLTPDKIAPKVGARTRAEILAYESDEDDDPRIQDLRAAIDKQSSEKLPPLVPHDRPYLALLASG